VNHADASSHQSFIDKNGFTAPLLIDRGFKVAEAYDAAGGIGPLKMNMRTVVGIGADGKIVYYQRGSPSTDEILKAVAPSS